jgi:hypothetical protein
LACSALAASVLTGGSAALASVVVSATRQDVSKCYRQIDVEGVGWTMTEDEERRRKAMTKEDGEDRIGTIKNDDECTSWQRKRIK